MSATLAQRRIIRARNVMIQEPRYGFYGCLAAYLGDPIPSDKTQTMATNGTSLFFNPDFVLGMSEAELRGVILHEVKHVALAHHARMKGRDARKWNEAADYAINPEILAQGERLPAGVLVDSAYLDMGAEAIYAARAQAERKAQEQQKPKPGDQQGQPGAGAGQGAPDQGKGSGQPQQGAGQPQQAGQGSGQPGKPDTSSAPGKAASSGQPGNQGQPGNGGGAGQPGAGAGAAGGAGQGAPAPMSIGEIWEAEGDTAAEIDKWKIRVNEAAAIARRMHAGKLPGDMARIVEQAMQPAALDCREIFAAFINSMVSTDYSFSRPNRRLIGRGFYLPGQTIDGLEHVIWAVDTSGSIDQHMLANASSEIVAAFESGKIQRLTIIWADSAVRSVQEFERGDEITLRPKGGGGTNFRPTFDRIARDYADATAVVYLTDMETRDFGSDPGMPVLWAIHGDEREFSKFAAKAPFGQAAYVGRLE